MITAVIIVLVMLVIMGIFGSIIYLIFKKFDVGGDSSENPNIKTTQEFLPFDDIMDDMIVLNKNHFRMVLQCTATNYILKTPGEKQQIEAAFQSFLNTITYPISFFIQTKVIDNTDRLDQLYESSTDAVTDFPSLTEYANIYYQNMVHLNEELGNNLQKKRYIIVTYDDAEDFSELTDDEKIVHAAKELRQRCNSIRVNLETVGVTASVLSTAELIELIYSSYNRSDYSFAQDLATKEALVPIVSGERDVLSGLDTYRRLDLLISESLKKFQHFDLSKIDSGIEIIDALEKLRVVVRREGDINEENW